MGGTPGRPGPPHLGERASFPIEQCGVSRARKALGPAHSGEPRTMSKGEGVLASRGDQQGALGQLLELAPGREGLK